MKKIISLLLVVIISAMSFSACGKKEETQASEPTVEAKNVEVTYRTDDYFGCKYSVPDNWQGTTKDTTVSYTYDDDKNNVVMVTFHQVDTGEGEWESRVKNAVDTSNANGGSTHFDKFSPINEAKNPTYYLEGEAKLSGGTYPYEAYLVNLDNKAILMVQNIGTDISNETENVRNIINTLDISGLADYLGVPKEAETPVDSSNGTEKSNEEFEVAIDVSGNWDDSRVVFEVNTNLPDEAELMLTLSAGDFNTDDNFMAQDKQVVSGGHFTTNGFSLKGEPLSGEYDLCVSMSLPSLQSDNVRAKIGEKGEYMTGSLVEDSDISDAKTVSALFSVSIGDEITVSSEDDYAFTIFRTEEEEEDAPVEETEEPAQETSAEDNKAYIEKYENDIVVAAKMALDNFITGYKVSLAPQNWTIAKFDDNDAVIAMTDITYNGATGKYLYVGTLSFDESGKVVSATPHYLAVDGVVLGDDGYCDDTFEVIESFTKK